MNRKNDRPWIYHPRVAVGFAILGLVAAIVLRNPFAVLGWIAATCGWLAAADRRAT
jgi:hypothetical protein